MAMHNHSAPEHPPLHRAHTAGYVDYFGGSACGIADAAAKTSQIRAAIEH